MPRVEKKEVFPYPADKIYDVIIDFEQYPSFVTGVDEIEVISSSQEQTEARYSLNMIKKFQYTIQLKHSRPTSVTWTLVGGDLFKKNDGGWKLKDLGDGTTEVTYYLDVEFKLFAPKMIVDKLVAQNLPQMLSAFKKRVGEV